VHQTGSADMYYKGASMLHTLRQWIDDDKLWRSILTGLNKEFYHQTVTTQQIENYISSKSKKDLASFFNQYLRTIKIPKLEWKKNGNQLTYRYVNVVEGFEMALKCNADGKTFWLTPTAKWKTQKIKGDFIVDPNFYIEIEEVK